MFILELVETCNDPGLANVLNIIKSALNLIWIIGPILGIIGLTIHLTKLMVSPEDQKLKAVIKNWAIGIVVVFMLPLIINVTMKLLDDSFELSTCWNYAASSSTDPNAHPDYIDPYSDSDKSNGFISNPDDYDEGSTEENFTVTRYIFVGDSRTVGMRSAVSSSSSDVWSCESGKGYTWMKDTGIPNIESRITSGSAVIILMGVNDLYHSDEYISYLNSNASSWTQKGAKVVFVSVNPTDGARNSLNSNIDKFNQKLKNSLSSNIQYIDTNSRLRSEGFSTTDGLHYTNGTYQKIYSIIKSSLS